MINFEYISEKKKLKPIHHRLLDQEKIAIDLEFDNNSFTYGVNICLYQIALSAGDIFLIDPIEMADSYPLKDVLENPSIKKVIHSASEDVNALKSQGGKLVNLVDTEKLARLAGMEKVGLSDLLHFFFDVQLDKELQRSNWNLRPLKKGATGLFCLGR